MAASVTPPRGMRDFLPAEKARREHALGVIRGVYAAHGFDEIETPVMEDSSRLHAGLGGDNEKIAFAVMKRGLTHEDLEAAAASGDALSLADLGLRYDLTVPLARFYATHRAALPPVFRAIQIAPVWRAERPQKGRYRQFVQCDIDIIGEAGPLAELELLTATVGDARRARPRRLHDPAQRPAHPGRHPRGVGRARRAARSRPDHDRQARQDRHRGSRGRAPRARHRHHGRGCRGRARGADERGLASRRRRRRAAVVARPGRRSPTCWHSAPRCPDAKIEFDPTLVRGMGYYTGTIFEIAHPDLGYSLGGGGRYDHMIGRFLGQEVPACGFSIGFERIVDLLAVRDEGRPRAVVLVYDGEVEPATLLALKHELVASGARVRFERRVKNMRALLDRVTADGFDAFASVTTETTDASSLAFRDLGA